MDKSDNPDLEQGDQIDTETPEDVVEPQEPTFVRIRLDGDTIEVPEHIATVIERAQMKATQTISRQGEELGRLRKQEPSPRQQQAASSTEEDPDIRFFTEPTKFLEEVLNKRDQQWYERQQLERAGEVYWGTFYQDNPQLRGKDPLVKAIAQQNLAYLSTLPPEQSRTELAEFVGTLLSNDDQGTKRRLPTKQVTAERASNPPPARSAQSQEPPPPKSVVSVLQARARQRHAALYRQPKDK